MSVTFRRSFFYTNFILSILLGIFFNFTIDARNKKPKDTLSYAVLLLINQNSEILLLRRKGVSFGNGLYSLPGGKIESGETAMEATRREAKEEIGINVDQLKLVHVIDYQGSETEFYIFVFRALVWQGDPLNCEVDKCDDMSWFPLDKIPENLIPAHKQSIELSQLSVSYSQYGWN